MGGDQADSRGPLVHQWTGLQKGTVSQLPDPGRVYKGLGVAKRYCRITVIGDTFLQCRLGTPACPPTSRTPPRK